MYSKILTYFKMHGTCSSLSHQSLPGLGYYSTTDFVKAVGASLYAVIPEVSAIAEGHSGAFLSCLLATIM